MHVVTYTPHGLIPDIRGFAPSLAAEYLAKYLLLFRNSHVCGQESHPLRYETDPVHGPVWRLKEGALYRRLFRKLTRLDPWPLHARLAHILRDMPVDLLHAHQLEFPVTDFRKRLGRKLPVILHAHAVREHRPELGLADAYVAVSDFTRNSLIEQGFPADRVHVVHNGADTDSFAPAPPRDLARLKAMLGLEGRRVIGYVGRKHEAKGYFDFLDALELLVHNNPDIRGVAAGAYPPEMFGNSVMAPRFEQIRRLVRQGVLIDLPAMPHAKLPRVFQVADVLLFPTRFSGEQHPMVLIEALASGCIVIATAIAGIPETTGNDTAILLERGAKAEDFASAALAVLDMPMGYVAMRANARELAVSSYDWRQKSLQLERIYFEALARAHG
jgi:glycosyltransferase involved in cell wall biosynthesis